LDSGREFFNLPLIIKSDTFLSLFSSFLFCSATASCAVAHECSIPSVFSVCVFSWTNRAEYVRLVLDFRLSEFAAPVRALRAGITSVIPARFLSLLTWKELETEACGQAEIDIEVLKANTVYSGCSPHDVHIKLFWTVLTSFSNDERARYLRFVWGRSRLPAGSKFSDKMRIDSTSNDITHLPQAHTCFFSIELPRVSGFACLLRASLRPAISASRSICSLLFCALCLCVVLRCSVHH
jgi:hypothetical protein